ncbi:hypothetical protein C8Q70DRAFT_1017213 [Cubamyces menziesii]|nr:hypothetical protein C8Q70DRAFT_1017213 [Cubamyces menziesii]
MLAVLHSMQIARLPLRGYLPSPTGLCTDAVRRRGCSRMRTSTQRGPNVVCWTRSLSTTSSMHDDDGDETLTQDPLTEETSRVRRRGPGRIISTVSPTRLTPADYMDISNLESAQCSLKHHASSSSSTRRSTAPRFRLFPTGFKRDVFPPDTHGFLYYDQDPRTPPLARELRFRVTSGPDPSLFASGHDLCCDNGLPYRIPLLNIASTHRCYSVVKQNLVKDGLVSPKIMRKASAQFPVRATRILHSFGQPFLLAFGTYMQNLHLVGWDVIRHISFRQILCIQRVTPSMIIRETDHPRPSPHTPHRLVTGPFVRVRTTSRLPCSHARRRCHL